MNLQETYYFSENEYVGIHKTTGEDFFYDFIRNCEKDFNKEREPFYANVFAANSNTFLLLKKSLQGAPDEIFGMETKDGEIDIEMNFEIEKYSKNKTIYGLSCLKKEDVPLLLVIDNNCSNNEFILKFVSDEEDDDGVIGEYIPDEKFELQTI